MKMKTMFLIVSALLSINTMAAQNISNVEIVKGCWGSTDADGNKITEDWLAGSSNTIVGVSQTKDKNNLMVEHGFLDVNLDSERDTLILTATFPGHPTNTFVLAQSTENELVFDALNSPVLNKIIYTKKSASSLNIRYIGKAGEDAFDFTNEFSRENCVSRF